MHRYTLRTASVLTVESSLDEARRLRALDDGLGKPPNISGLDLYETRAALVGHHWQLEAAKAEHRRASKAALSPAGRTRRDGEWPRFDDIVAWRNLGASHALQLTHPRIVPLDQRPHALAYTAAWTAVMGAYMETGPQPTSEAAQWTPPEHPPMLGPWRTSSHSTPLLDEAMCTAQEMLDPALKTSNNPHFKSKYADLAEIIAVVKPAFAHARIARYQAAWTDDKPGVVITTRLAHKGEWCEADLRIPVDKNNAQALGAAVTYGKRFGLAAMAGVPTEDDDGNAAAAAPPPNAKTDAIGARCSGKGWPGDLGREVHQLAQDLATLGGGDHMDVWWELLPDAGVVQQPYMDTDGAWPAHARVLSTSDGKLVKAAALKKIADARQT